MEQDVRDRALLAILEPEDRVQLLEVVERFVTDELAVEDPQQLRTAAVLFERRAEARPLDEKLVGLQIAAALRLRASSAEVH